MLKLDAIETVTWVALDPCGSDRQAIYINGDVVRVGGVDDDLYDVFQGFLDCLLLQGWPGEYQVITLDPVALGEYPLGEWEFPTRLEDLDQLDIPEPQRDTYTHTYTLDGESAE